MGIPSTSNGLVTPQAAKSEIAELADVYFFHPLGAVCARLAAALRLTPTQLTVIGALVGVTGGVMLYEKRLGLLGFALLILHGIIDSADGQLARLTGRTTELGKVLDGGSGYVTHAAIYLAIGAGMMHRGGSSATVLWMVLAGIATIAHAQMYEYHRTVYSSVVGEGRVPRQEKRRVAMFVKRMPGAIEKFSAFDQKRRHPGRIVRINTPGKFDEGVAFGARLDRSYLDFSHGPILPLAPHVCQHQGAAV